MKSSMFDRQEGEGWADRERARMALTRRIQRYQWAKLFVYVTAATFVGHMLFNAVRIALFGI